MKNILIAGSVFIGAVALNAAFAVEGEMQHPDHQHDMSMHHNMSMMDMRISLGASGDMKQHQLSNMRSHVEAIKTIVGLMAEKKFEEASKIAHSKLGQTPEMLAMCGNFHNEKFEALGQAFHRSGDDLGEALHTKDVNASLSALNRTMQFCVECHATYRQ